MVYLVFVYGWQNWQTLGMLNSEEDIATLKIYLHPLGRLVSAQSEQGDYHHNTFIIIEITPVTFHWRFEYEPSPNFLL